PKSKPCGSALREKGSAASNAEATASTRWASSAVSAKIEMVSSDLQAGTTPVADSRPQVGLWPTRLLNEAGTRPEPAVSVPSEKLAYPLATATADPELDPPEMYSGSKLLRQAP